MIECPRCSFIQPEDRYCASCGLDIENYKPKPRHWSIKLVRSPIFQACLSLLIVIGLIWSLFRSQNQNLQAQFVAIENAFDSDVDPDEESENPLPPPEPTTKTISPPKAVPAAHRAEHTAPADPQPDPSDTLAVAPAFKIPDTLSALFFEVSRDLLAESLKEAQSISILPTLQIFRLNNLDKLKALSAGGRRLPGSLVRLPFREGNPLRIEYLFPTITNPQIEMGLRLEIAYPTRGASDDSRFASRVSGSLMGVQRGAENQSLALQMDDLVEASLDQPIAILGLIPNNIFVPAQPAEISKTPFAVLGSLAFQQNNNEVLLVLQFENLARDK